MTKKQTDYLGPYGQESGHEMTAQHIVTAPSTEHDKKQKAAAQKWLEKMQDASEEVEIDEALTDKTIRSSDKIKVARVIADMLGVEKAESMSPEQAIAQGLRSIKNKRMTPELIGVLKKMLALAQEVGIKVDKSLVPKSVNESVVVDKTSKRNLATDVLTYQDFMKLMKVQEQEKNPDNARNSVITNPEGDDEYKNNESDFDADDQQRFPHETGTSLVAGNNDHLRRRKVHYHREEVELKEGEEEHDISDDEMDKMVSSIDHEDDILDAYDDDELKIVDQDTGEEIEEEVNEEVLNEVLSRSERMRARIRFMQTSAKRQRRMQIALHRRSDAKTINKRARRLAINMIKQRIMKKKVSQMSVSEKERAEKFIQSRGALINRLAMKMAPRVRKIESDRLSHPKATK